MVNLLVDLDDPRFAQDAVHHALEALLRTRDVYVAREHRAAERTLAWLDAEFGGAWSSEAAASGIWTASAAAEPVGFAAFDSRERAYHWLQTWGRRDGVGIFGPLGVSERLRRRGIGGVLLRAALFSLRERGYRHALVPAVGQPELVAYYAEHAGARIVEAIDPGRGGRRWRATVLASGNGSNAQALFDGAAGGAIPFDVVALVAGDGRAFAVERAARAGIPAHVVAWDRARETRAAYDERLSAVVAATRPDVVVLLGWMHVLPAAFVARFPDILNLHPAFLPLDPSLDCVTMPDASVIPAYRGAHAFAAALADGSAWSGATVHRLGVAVDRGTVLARAPLRLPPGEAREESDARLHALERRVVATAANRWSWEQR